LNEALNEVPVKVVAGKVSSFIPEIVEIISSSCTEKTFIVDIKIICNMLFALTS